ncbi:MAG TPA: hypothetical protein VGD36_08435 [Xanthobacteraceae bacterium]
MTMLSTDSALREEAASRASLERLREHFESLNAEITSEHVAALTKAIEPLLEDPHEPA